MSEVKRKRRTNEEIIRDMAAEKCILDASLSAEQALILAKDEFLARKNKSSEVKEVASESAEPKTVSSGIELIPIEASKTETANIELQIEKAANRAANSVLQAAYDELNRRTETLLEKINHVSMHSKFIVGIKINGNEVKKLETGAHDKLPELIQYCEYQAKTPGSKYPALFGPAGCGKSKIAEDLAKALGLEFFAVNFTAGLSETCLMGRHTVNGFIEGPFAKAYRNGGVFLADELDAADPNLLVAMNGALAGNFLLNIYTGEMIPRHPNFRFIAAMNTVGKGGDMVFTGRQRLDGSTLDRLIFWQIGYNEKIENAICPDPELLKTLRSMRDCLERVKSKEVISYRSIATAYLLKSCMNKSHKEIVDHLSITFNGQDKTAINGVGVV